MKLPPPLSRTIVTAPDNGSTRHSNRLERMALTHSTALRPSTPGPNADARWAVMWPLDGRGTERHPQTMTRRCSKNAVQNRSACCLQERGPLSRGSSLPQHVEGTYTSARAAIRMANGVKVQLSSMSLHPPSALGHSRCMSPNSRRESS